jgi:beta-barrel assembly-enhancing protease
MMKNIKYWIIATGLIMTLAACGLGKDGSEDVPSGGFNLFSVEQDKELGAQVAAELEANPAEYPVLDSASNVAAYKYIYGIRDKILATGKVTHKDDFLWQVRIIDNDTTLNAFCTPGGYIYFYTGIIKYLENEAELAGVMGHEMGHADLRHSTRQMTKIYGVQILAAAALGEREALKQITTGLIGLKFSRSHETEADRMSVEYLCATTWPADGGAGFFEKIEAQGGAGVPEFMSTHPSPDNRIENYHKWAKESNCPGNDNGEMSFREFQALFD